MAISKTTEDLLPSLGKPVSGSAEAQRAGFAAAAAPAAAVTAAPATALARHISGCVALIGPLQVCYDINTDIPSALITLKVGPVILASAEIDPTKPCIHFEGDYEFTKWKLDVCLRGTSITLGGQACVMFVGCKDFSITLISW